MSYSSQEFAKLVETPEYKQAQQELEQILARSATDSEFRQKLLTDPRAALAEFGKDVPEGMDIRFVENHGHATVVLPDAIDPEAELSEDDLDTVAGGAFPVIVIISSSGCAAAGSAAVSALVTLVTR